jgi:hypothetical protein
MNTNKLTWQDGVKILLAFMTFGVGWFADNQVTMIAFAATIVVWLIGYATNLSPSFAWIKGKGPLTALVFVVAFVLSYLFQPFSVPAFPAWPGDAGAFVPMISDWFSAFFAIIAPAVTFAMTIYNLLLSQIYEKAGGALDTLRASLSPQ